MSKVVQTAQDIIDKAKIADMDRESVESAENALGLGSSTKNHNRDYRAVGVASVYEPHIDIAIVFIRSFVDHVIASGGESIEACLRVTPSKRMQYITRALGVVQQTSLPLAFARPTVAVVCACVFPSHVSHTIAKDTGVKLLCGHTVGTGCRATVLNELTGNNVLSSANCGASLCSVHFPSVMRYTAAQLASAKSAAKAQLDKVTALHNAERESRAKGYNAASAKWTTPAAAVVTIRARLARIELLGVGAPPSKAAADAAAVHKALSTNSVVLACYVCYVEVASSMVGRRAGSGAAREQRPCGHIVHVACAPSEAACTHCVATVTAAVTETARRASASLVEDDDEVELSDGEADLVVEDDQSSQDDVLGEGVVPHKSYVVVKDEAMGTLKGYAPSAKAIAMQRHSLPAMSTLSAL